MKTELRALTWKALRRWGVWTLLVYALLAVVLRLVGEVDALFHFDGPTHLSVGAEMGLPFTVLASLQAPQHAWAGLALAQTSTVTWYAALLIVAAGSAVFTAHGLDLLEDSAHGKVRRAAFLNPGQARRNQTLAKHEGARFANGRKDVAKMLAVSGRSLQTRVPLGRVKFTPMSRTLHLSTEPDASTMVIAPPGGGKTVGIVVPTMLSSAFENANILVTSVKSDVEDATFRWRQGTGKVWSLNPHNEGAMNVKPSRWSMLDNIVDYDDARLVATTFVKNDPKNDAGGNTAFFLESSVALLAPMLLAAALTNEPLSVVSTWALSPMEYRDDISTRLIQAGAVAALAFQDFNAVMERPSKALGDVFATLQGKLSVFKDQKVLNLSDTKHLDVDDTVINPAEFVAGKGNTIYVVTSSVAQQSMRPLLTAFVNSVVHAGIKHANANKGKLPQPLIILMDEAANVAPLPDLPQYTSTGRSMGINFILIYQSFAQLESLYGDDDASALLANCRGLVVLGGSKDGKLHETVSRMLGQTKHVAESTSKGSDRGSKSVTTSMESSSLMSPNEIQQMPDNTALIIYSNCRAVRTDLRAYFEDETLKGRSDGSRSDHANKIAFEKVDLGAAGSPLTEPTVIDKGPVVDAKEQAVASFFHGKPMEAPRRRSASDFKTVPDEPTWDKDSEPDFS